MSQESEKAETPPEQPQKKLIPRAVKETLDKIEGFFLLPPHPATKKLSNGRSAHYCDAMNFYQLESFRGLFAQSFMNSQIPMTLASIMHELVTGEGLQESKKSQKIAVGTRWVKDPTSPGGEREEPIYEERAKPETSKAKDVVAQMREAYTKLAESDKDVRPETILSDCHFVLKTTNEILKQEKFYFANDRPGVEQERKTRGELMNLTLQLRDIVTGVLPHIDSSKMDEKTKQCLEDSSKIIKENIGKSSVLRTPTAFFQSLSDPTKEITAFLNTAEKPLAAQERADQKPGLQ